MSGHLSDVDISSYVNGELGWLKKLRVKGHFEHCPSCRQRIEQAEKSLEEERAMADMLAHYNRLEVEADATMTAPVLSAHE